MKREIIVVKTANQANRLLATGCWVLISSHVNPFPDAPGDLLWHVLGRG